MSNKAKFEISLGPTGTQSTVILNGEDISAQIDRIWISTGSRDITEVEVRFIAAEVHGWVEGDFTTWTDGEDMEGDD